MKVRVVYNEFRKKYRIAYKRHWWNGWRWATRLLVRTNISETTLTRYIERVERVAEFDAIGEAEEFIAMYIAPRSQWYDPRSEEWTPEAEVDISKAQPYIPPEEKDDVPNS